MTFNGGRGEDGGKRCDGDAGDGSGGGKGRWDARGGGDWPARTGSSLVGSSQKSDSAGGFGGGTGGNHSGGALTSGSSHSWRRRSSEGPFELPARQLTGHVVGALMSQLQRTATDGSHQRKAVE